MLQEGKLLSFGRPTYGRLGRQDVSTGSDDAVAEAKPVANLDGVDVKGMAAGESTLHHDGLVRHHCSTQLELLQSVDPCKLSACVLAASAGYMMWPPVMRLVADPMLRSASWEQAAC